ncbi:hypothetical protein AWW66_24395 [Micromonospora rosaria]|uniref:Uncharacterized protein n=1 Tax=Micromonospora rosaria TaxID=47874 RepID=A0A136PM64_9ACTN|nr:hypothetical protein [Micromonospora rosaria]KXK59406.1 hypothetical protein AWW66_24395 [Micromonospora rosaria]
MTSRDDAGEGRGPQSPDPYGTSDGFDADPPWGAGENNPMGEGSEETAVPPGRWGERRAAEPAGSDHPAGRHGFGPVPSPPPPAAGPGAPPDPAPGRRPFPDDSAEGDLADNALEEATGMHPEGVSRDE